MLPMPIRSIRRHESAPLVENLVNPGKVVVLDA